MRAVDDDNGNLNDGTPHGAALGAAFNRRHRLHDRHRWNTAFVGVTPPAAVPASRPPGANSVALSWNGSSGRLRHLPQQVRLQRRLHQGGQRRQRHQLHRQRGRQRPYLLPGGWRSRRATRPLPPGRRPPVSVTPTGAPAHPAGRSDRRHRFVLGPDHGLGQLDRLLRRDLVHGLAGDGEWLDRTARSAPPSGEPVRRQRPHPTAPTTASSRLNGSGCSEQRLDAGVPSPPRPAPAAKDAHTNGVPVTGISGALNSQPGRWRCPAGASALSSQSLGGTGDADMYVRSAPAPTTSYDCRPYGSGNAETCNIADGAGRYLLRHAERHAACSACRCRQLLDHTSGGL